MDARYVMGLDLGPPGEPTGFSKVLAPFMAAAMRRANRKDLAVLRAILETD